MDLWQRVREAAGENWWQSAGIPIAMRADRRLVAAWLFAWLAPYSKVGPLLACFPMGAVLAVRIGSGVPCCVHFQTIANGGAWSPRALPAPRYSSGAGNRGRRRCDARQPRVPLKDGSPLSVGHVEPSADDAACRAQQGRQAVTQLACEPQGIHAMARLRLSDGLHDRPVTLGPLSFPGRRSFEPVQCTFKACASCALTAWYWAHALDLCFNGTSIRRALPNSWGVLLLPCTMNAGKRRRAWRAGLRCVAGVGADQRWIDGALGVAKRTTHYFA